MKQKSLDTTVPPQAPQGRRSGLKTLDTVLVAAAAVVAVLVAFTVLHFIVGLVWFAVKTVVVLGVVAGVAWLLVRRRH